MGERDSGISQSSDNDTYESIGNDDDSEESDSTDEELTEKELTDEGDLVGDRNDLVISESDVVEVNNLCILVGYNLNPNLINSV